MADETKIHFLNVGHGDCTVIKHPWQLTVIDTANAEAIDESVIKHKLGSDVKKAVTYYTYRELGLSDRQALAKAGITLDLTNPVEFIKTHYPGEAMFRYIQTHPEMDHMRGLAALKRSVEIVKFWDTENHRPGNAIGASDESDWKAYQEMRFQ